jgi:hypothetical protein
VCEGGGVSARLGASKRRMLSLADRPSLVEVPAWLGTDSVTGAAEGIVAGVVCQLGERRGRKEKSGDEERVVSARRPDAVNGSGNGNGNDSGGGRQKKIGGWSWGRHAAGGMCFGRLCGRERCGGGEAEGNSPYGCSARAVGSGQRSRR